MEDFKDMLKPGSTGLAQNGASMSDLSGLFNESQSDGLDSRIMKGLSIAARAYGIEKDTIKSLDTKLKKRKADHRERELALFDMFQAAGLTMIKADGRTFFQRVDTYASVDAANRRAARKWVEGIGCEYLITETINAKSLTREIKAYIEDGGEAPGEDQGIKLRTENRVGALKK
jgi:uncharacterized protein (UPF0335 family)